MAIAGRLFADAGAEVVKLVTPGTPAPGPWAQALRAGKRLVAPGDQWDDALRHARIVLAGDEAPLPEGELAAGKTIASVRAFAEGPGDDLLAQAAGGIVAGPDIDASGGWDAAIELVESQRMPVWASPATGGNRIGFPEDPGSSVGPVIDRESYDRIKAFLEAASADATLAYSVAPTPTAKAKKSKLKTATELGLEVMTEDEWLALVAGE